MHKCEKGDYNYLQRKKVSQLFIAFIGFLIVMLVIVSGYIKYGNTKNIMTVIGIVGVIPASKFLVSYIVMFPYKSPDHEKYKLLSKYDVILLCGMVMTSVEKVSFTDYIVIKEKHVYVYISNTKKVNEVQKYLKELLTQNFPGCAFKAFTDFEKYIDAVEKISHKEYSSADNRITDFVKVNTI